jgi:hypothetical protein
VTATILVAGTTLMRTRPSGSPSAFVLVEPVPAAEVGVFHAPLLKQVNDDCSPDEPAPTSSPGLMTCLQRTALGVSDEADRSRSL